MIEFNLKFNLQKLKKKMKDRYYIIIKKKNTKTYNDFILTIQRNE